MTYLPARDWRFDNVSDVAEHIEEMHCVKGCRFAVNATSDQPSGDCELMLKLVLEQPILEWTDLGRAGLVCDKREAP